MLTLAMLRICVVVSLFLDDGYEIERRGFWLFTFVSIFRLLSEPGTENKKNIVPVSQ